MNQIIATAQQILDFKVGNISVGSVIQGLVLLIIFNRIISMIMGPIIDKILDRFKLETTVQGFIKGFIKVILNFVALCVVADSIGHRYSDCIRPGCCRHVRSGNFPVRTGSFVQRCQRISYFSYEAL